ncbi:RNA-directed DNA polymerase (Reverse transcriptase) [Rhynchospora pubera]|uniref:RNA-directed DNA polymerase (Reverse transcriptase) n=1 Tax=Rhynchospora pubera TaxID=906938 RepID=A0AAV8FSJ4_9POAL|nr:RNA-directed DNA polymerase (Reverse transcriptase) [Rhynchospora pubera]
MGDTNQAEVNRLGEVMHKFGYISGLQINPQKSGLWFSKNCDELTKHRVQQMWGARRVAAEERYLGALLGLKGDGRRMGALLLEKMKAKLSGWKSNMLSHAGRLVMIKSVLMSMPVYSMALEMLPRTIVKEMNILLAKFFWGKTDKSRYLSFIAWRKVCKPIEFGGLGIKDLQTFGEALFLKIVWFLMADENKLWVQICKAKVLSGGWLLESKELIKG